MKHHQHNLPAIYRITDLRNGKVYVGQAKNVRVRWRIHLSDLRRGVHKNGPLQEAWASGHPEDFAWDIVCEPIGGHDPETMTHLEVHVLGNYTDTFNLMVPVQAYLGAGKTTRVKLSEKQLEIWSRPALRAKRVAALRAQKDDPEYQKTHRAAMMAFSRTPEGKAVRKAGGAKASKAWVDDPSLVEAQSKRHRDLWADPAYREKQRQARSASWTDDEKRQRRVDGLKASWARLTPEQHAERVAKAQARKNDPEAKAKHAAAVRAAWDKRRARA